MQNLTNSQKLINMLWDKANVEDLSPVALSNEYEDLNWKPTIPVVNNPNVTFQKNEAM